METLQFIRPKWNVQDALIYFQIKTGATRVCFLLFQV